MTVLKQQCNSSLFYYYQIVCLCKYVCTVSTFVNYDTLVSCLSGITTPCIKVKLHLKMLTELT